MANATEWVSRHTGAFLFVCMLTWGGMSVVGMIAAVVWALDDNPPIELVRYKVSPTHPGDTMFIEATVKRDLDRECSSTYSRYVMDSRGTIHGSIGDTTMSADGIRRLDHRNPDKLSFAVATSKDMPIGTTTIVTPITSRCNPWHILYPIAYSFEMTTEILAP